MDTPDQKPQLLRAFRIAYALGLCICVAWPLLLQLMLRVAIKPGSPPPEGVVRQLGYTFTGLTFASALFVTWRWGRVRKAFAGMPEDRKPGTMLRETLLYAAIFELSSLYGLVYYALGGQAAERYSRSFIALTTVMFFVFVPRLHAWLETGQEELP